MTTEGETPPGDAMWHLAERMYPLPRSITGEGTRRTLDLVEEALDGLATLQRTEVPTGTEILDWTVPPEWSIREAWIRDPGGNVVVDFAESNLHVMGYSTPVHKRMPLERLQEHLHSLPEHPDLVPYRTSYYDEAWGFCLPDRVRRALPEGEYEVCIDSTLAPGSLTYAECILPGESEDEVLISVHTCHPSLADDNLSGIAVATYAARAIAARSSRRFTHRLVFAPGTIGAIAWLARNQDRVGRIRHGLTLSCVGDGRPFTYKRTFAGDHEVDRVASYVVRSRPGGEVIDYFPYGYDERQYNSPGFRAPVGALMRARHGTFPEYHTSGDDLGFISAEHLGESLDLLLEVLYTLEANRRYVSLSPYGEPQLGRRGLFQTVGGLGDPGANLAMLWVLACADGEHDLLAVAERSGADFVLLARTAALLVEQGLIEAAETPQR